MPSADVITLTTMPRWYARLFTADMLERFSFYGLQAVLVLYASAPAGTGGLGMDGADATGLFGGWIALTFTLSLPGGWIGDRVLGPRRAMQVGCSLSAIGLLVLGWGSGAAAAIGLGVLAVGNALFKPNHQAMLNLLFGNGASRESGISLMFVATQVSSLIAPIAGGFLGERVSWPAAFSLCALAIALAGVRVATAATTFGGIGGPPPDGLSEAHRRAVITKTGAALISLAVLLIVLSLAGKLTVSTGVSLIGVLLIVVTVLGYRSLHRDPGLDSADRSRLRAFLAVLGGAALFWMIFAYSGSLLTLFVRDHVQRDLGDFLVPASWLQSMIPLFTLLFAPVIAAWLPRIGRRDKIGVKFAIGLSLIGTGFLVMAVAAATASTGVRVSPLFLVASYLLAALGELVIAAISIAATAEVLPRSHTARMLGMYWLFAGLGSALGAVLLRLLVLIPEQAYYLGLGSVAIAVAVLFLVFRARLTAALRVTEPVSVALRSP